MTWWNGVGRGTLLCVEKERGTNDTCYVPGYSLPPSATEEGRRRRYLNGEVLLALDVPKPFTGGRLTWMSLRVLTMTSEELIIYVNPMADQWIRVLS